MTVQSWSPTAANNVLANTGFTMDEGMAPSAVNDSVRQLMADVKTRFDGDFATTATAAGTTTLTASSVSIQEFTGVTTQTLVLPVCTTLTAGRGWMVINNSTGTVTINTSGGTLVKTLYTLERAIVLCVLASGTSAASWAVGSFPATTAEGAVTLQSTTVMGAVTEAGTANGATITTTPVVISPTAASGGGLAFVSAYNASGGNRGWWLVGFRDAVADVIASNNNTGLTVNFTASSSQLLVATASGSIVVVSKSFTH